MTDTTEEMCPCCGRTNAIMSEHHLVPKSMGGKFTILICSDCHNAIHARYSNKELAESFYRWDLLMRDEDLKRAFKFLAKQDPQRRFRNRRSKKRTRKGKYQ